MLSHFVLLERFKFPVCMSSTFRNIPEECVTTCCTSVEVEGRFEIECVSCFASAPIFRKLESKTGASLISFIYMFFFAVSKFPIFPELIKRGNEDGVDVGMPIKVDKSDGVVVIAITF